MQFVVDANGAGAYDALAVALPAGVKSLTLGFVGGSLEPVAVASPVVWVGPASLPPAYLGVTLANGTTIDCGAGSVGSVADLRDSRLTALAARAPWACLGR